MGGKRSFFFNENGFQSSMEKKVKEEGEKEKHILRTCDLKPARLPCKTTHPRRMPRVTDLWALLKGFFGDYWLGFSRLLI